MVRKIGIPSYNIAIIIEITPIEIVGLCTISVET